MIKALFLVVASFCFSPSFSTDRLLTASSFNHLEIIIEESQHANPALIARADSLIPRRPDDGRNRKYIATGLAGVFIGGGITIGGLFLSDVTEGALGEVIGYTGMGLFVGGTVFLFKPIKENKKFREEMRANQENLNQ